MRATDNRYSQEQSQFQLALRMIRHEARTGTIKDCTGLSDDRIRKIYNTYVAPLGTIRRRRGKSPRQVLRFVKSPEHRLQATTLVSLFRVGLLISVNSEGRISTGWPRPDLDLGHRLCRAYETYCLIYERPLFNFEWAWNLLQNIGYGDELYLARCDGCATRYVQDAFAIDEARCPSCKMTSG